MSTLTGIEMDNGKRKADDGKRELVMQDSAKAAFLRTQIDERIAGFQGRRDWNRRRAFWFKISTSGFGVVVTVLLGLRLDGMQELFGNIAFVLSGAISLLNALEGFFDYKALWVQYTVTTNQLHALRSDLEYLLAGEPDSVPEEELDRIYDRYSVILEETNRMWAEAKESRSESP